MPSTRASSPASAGSTPSSPMLTPRSKVKAMLAAMDSDEDSVTTFPKPQSTSLFRNLPKSTRQSPVDDRQQVAANGENTEDEEDDISRPRGRMAARMKAAEENNQESPADNARERVRRMLAEESKKTKQPSSDAEVQDDSSEDGDIQLGSRRRQARKLRTSTPEPVTRNLESPGGLFVSPGSERHSRPASVASEDDDLPQNLNSDARFHALVQKKREERKAKEAELAKEKAEKAAKMKNFSDMIDQDEELDVTDSETEQRMTQPVRAGRKASKRALEEMKRETQRMSRNMQLAHEARTKKKITKASLFAKFNYRQSDPTNVESANETRPASSSSAVQSESEARETTPPTSPSLTVIEAPTALGTPARKEAPLALVQNLEDDEVFMSLEDVLAQVPKKANKGKEKAPQDVPSSPPSLEQSYKNDSALKRNRKDLIQQPATLEDSDSDLEITYSAPRAKSRKEKINAIFDRVPARQGQESHSLQTLRLLAHLSSPGKTNKGKSAKPSMTSTELQMSLQQRIRQQAARERAEREKALRDRGITVLTAEEREKEMVDVEDLIAKARREADEITKKEKDESKRKRKENGEVDPLGDSSDDEDWQQEDKEDVEELSGSGSENELYDGLDDVDGDASGEEEDDEDAILEDGEGDEPTNDEVTVLFDNEASETESEEETGVDVPNETEVVQTSDQEEEEEEEDDILPAVPTRRRAKNIISDDEEEPVGRPVDRTPAVKHFGSPMPPKTISPIAPNSVLRSATKTFIPGLTVAGPAGLGLTQIFQGTMDDSQTQLYSDTTVVPETSSGGNGQDSMAFLRRMPPPTLPAFESTVDEESQDIIMDSQPDVTQVPASQPPDEVSQPLQLQFSQSQIHGFDSLVQDPFATQYSENLEPTQDVGFQTQSPLKTRFVSQSQGPQSTVPQSTVDTVLVDTAPMILEEGGDSPTVKKLGRLRRRNQIQRQLDEEDAEATNEMNLEDEEGFDISANAFDVMRRAAKKKTVVEEFDKNKSKAKEMVHDQAEESEDEYAGLGGVSDDESGGEDDALVKAMIDDEAGKEPDERQLAAFYADKERAKDSKDVEKLFKDITNGMLRRKRGGDYSLSDSEDDGEARRNQKRKEFARMRKALLEDERIGKIAQNPKQSAFLAAIEDREKDDEIDFLDTFEDSQEVFESQGESQGKDTEMTDGVQVPGSQPDTSMGPPKRKRSDDDTSDIENRPPPNLRRTKGKKRPSNLSEIRESLSSLVEDPNSNLDLDDSDSESDLEIVDQADEDGSGSGSGTDKESRRRDAVERDPFAARRNANIAVVDRISLKRSSSSNVSSTTKLAFSAPTTSSLYNVKVPPLLRKATSNLSTTSTSSGITSMGKGALEGAAGLASTGTGIKRGGGRTSGIAYQARETERRKAVEEGEKKREKRKFKGAERRREVVGGLFGRGTFE